MQEYVDRKHRNYERTHLWLTAFKIGFGLGRPCPV